MDQAGEADDLVFERSDGIGRITFNRPQARNAFTFAMYERLAAICEQANDDGHQGAGAAGAGDKASASAPTSTSSANSRRRRTPSTTRT